MATSHLRDLCFDCTDPDRVAHFWAAVLGYTLAPPPPEEPPDPSIAIQASAGGLRIWFNKVRSAMRRSACGGPSWLIPRAMNSVPFHPSREDIRLEEQRNGYAPQHISVPMMLAPAI